MSDNLTILGEDYTGVTGIKATDTSSGNTLIFVRPQGTKSITANGTGIDVAAYATADVSVSVSPNLQAKTNIAPTTSSQTITADSGYDGLSSVQINAMPSGTAGTPTATKGTVSNHAISVTPSVTNITGYITGSTKTGTAVSVSASELVSETLTINSSGTKDVTNYASASVAAGSAKPASVISDINADVERDGTTLYLSKTVSNTPQVTAGYVSSGTAGDSFIELSATDSNWTAANIKKNVSIFGITGTYAGAAPNLQAKTNIAPSTSSQTIQADSGYDGLSSVQINAMPSGSVTAAATITGTSATVSHSSTTLTLSKTVSNTPRVTTAGYVSSGTAGNSAVSLSATDSNFLASNIKKDVSIFGVTGTYEGGGGTSKNAQTAQSTTRSTSTSGTSVISLTCTKTGTYDVYWTTFRSSTSGTWGSRLYIGGTAYETMQTGSWSNHIQNRHVSNVSISANQKVAVYVQSRGSNYYGYVGTLTIIES